VDEQKRRKGASLSDIARHVGVTVGTASRALNGYQDISDATRARVAEAARALNYRPSSNARRLARGTQETIGYVLPRHAINRTDAFLPEMLEGISQALSARDFDLLVVSLESAGDELDSYRRLVESGKVSGLIVARTLTDDPRVAYLSEAGVPFVCHGRTAACDRHAWLDIDNEKAAADALHHLHNMGHGSIAMIAADPTFNFARLRIAGYRKALDEHGLEERAGYLQTADLSAESGAGAMLRLLDLDAPPTGVICVTDMVAIGAMQAAREKGLAVGRDISVIGYDGLPVAAFTDPPLTTMTQDVIETGRRVTEILLQIIDGKPPTEFQEMWNARLIKRGSDGPPATAASTARQRAPQGE